MTYTAEQIEAMLAAAPNLARQCIDAMRERDTLRAALSDPAALAATPAGQALVMAERERCARIAGEAMCKYAKDTYSNDEGRMQNAAKTYCADEIATAIRADIPAQMETKA